MVIDIDTMRPKLAGKTGGLSGPAIRPIAVRAIYQVHAAIPKVPILGMGGVTSGRDALELVFAGASGISIGTATFGNPTAAMKVKNELAECRYPKIVVGDFNDVPVSYTYREISSGLNDAFVESGSGLETTYKGPFPSFRIDYILFSDPFKCEHYKS